MALHTDGQRATVPDHVSLTQPDALVARTSWALDSSLPSSTAQPALGARRALASQLPRQRLSATQGEDTGQEFTQALGYFTQSSAAPSGVVMQLTRFYSASDPHVVVPVLSAALQRQKAQYIVDKIGDELDVTDMQEDLPEGPGTAPTTWQHAQGARIRLGLVDRRKCALKGEVRIERVAALPPDLGGAPGTFVLMRRSKGSPLEWRRLFRDLCRDADVQPLLARPYSS